MSEFNSIINPNTMDKVSLFGQEGGNILSKYVNIYKNIQVPSNKQKNKDMFKTETLKEHNNIIKDNK
jgi:hypothetical protein